MSETMIKAAVSRGADEPLAIELLVLSGPEAEEVRVKVEASAICHSDLFYIAGAWGEMPPTVYGHEVSGVVVEVAVGVDSVAVGDSVVATLIRYCGVCFYCARGEMTQCRAIFALAGETRLHTEGGEPIGQGVNVGGFAEQVVVHQSQTVKIPSSFPYDLAAPIACGVATGFGAVRRTTAVPVGSSVVVIGAGGVGLNAIQGAVVSGASPIVAVDLAEWKLKAATVFGATHGCVPTGAGELVSSLTEGRGADFVFVTAGSGKAIDQGMDLMRRGGNLVVVGMPPSGVTTSLELGNLAAAGQRIIGSKMGSTQPQIDIPEMIAMYQDGQLKLDELVTGRYNLQDINEAIASVHAGTAIRNVIIF